MLPFHLRHILAINFSLHARSACLNSGIKHTVLAIWQVTCADSYAARLVEDIDDAEDVEAELEAEKQLLMRQGADATGGAMVLKVQCEKGEVQIRQQPGSNFVGLMDKFRAYAEKQGWAKKSTKMILECDGDRVDLKNSSPEEFDLEDGMALDVVMK